MTGPVEKNIQGESGSIAAERAIAVENTNVPPPADFIDYLERNAARLDFFNVLERIEGLCAGGKGDPFTNGTIRFGLDTSFVFPAGDIASIHWENGRFTITPSFMGLADASTPLPFYFAEYAGRIDEILKERNGGEPWRPEDLGVLAFVDLLTIFNHRVYALFYLAWKKYACLRAGTAPGPLERCIAALAGLQRERAEGPELCRRLVYAGLFAGTPRGAGGLELLLSGHFGGIPVRVQEFVPRRAPLTAPTRLGATAALGRNAVCGDSVFDRTGKFRVSIGPVEKKFFDDFVSGGTPFSSAATIVDAYTADPLEYDFELLLKADVCVPVTLGTGTAKLGETGSLGLPSDADDRVLSILVEPRR